MDSSNTRKVYSSEHGRLCPRCQRPEKQCACQERARQQLRGDGKVRVQRQLKGRGGKTVTVISGLPLTGGDLKSLASDLKRGLGTGGAVKGDNIEIQGDYADRLVDELKRRGYTPKRSGG